jgi:hypothetical protein
MNKICTVITISCISAAHILGIIRNTLGFWTISSVFVFPANTLCLSGVPSGTRKNYPFVSPYKYENVPTSVSPGLKKWEFSSDSRWIFFPVGHYSISDVTFHFTSFFCQIYSCAISVSINVITCSILHSLT